MVESEYYETKTEKISIPQRGVNSKLIVQLENSKVILIANPSIVDRYSYKDTQIVFPKISTRRNKTLEYIYLKGDLA